MTQPMNPEAEVLEEPADAPTEARAVVARGPWALAWRRLRKDKVAMVSAVLLVLMCLLAIFAPLVASILGQNPLNQDIMNGLDANSLPVGPSGSHLLGTDQVGRDLLIRIVYGARVSLGIGLLSTLLAVVIGVAIGLMAGFLGGVVDIVLARFIDVVLSMPFLLVGIGMVAVFGQSLVITIIVIAFFSWAGMARIVRGQVLSLREREFVEAARSLGAGNWRIMTVDILPNLLMPIIVYASLQVPIAVVSEATLAYLGLGVPAPTPDWGDMINQSSQADLYQHAWWMVVFPGAALLLTTLAFNLLGDGVRDAFDPNADRLLKK
jgi:ABC-type dipeptide/oligopeptide/nickel transport system permease subunit